MLKHILGLALLLPASSLAAAIPATPPIRPHYCQPLAYRDYEIFVGRAALLRPGPLCKIPSLVRKVSDLSGRVDVPLEVPLMSNSLNFTRMWLFVSHLEYSLDGRSWKTLRLEP